MPKKPKPKKPYPDFPLFLHATAQWAKKIGGKTYYFGKVAKDALDKYLKERDDLQAGRTPRATAADVLTLCELVNQFLDSKKRQLNAGELTRLTWSDYYTACEAMIGFFGADRSVTDLHPEDFDRYRAKLAENRGPVTVGNAILRTRIVFKWGFDNELIIAPVRFGTSFNRPSAKSVRKARHSAGSRMIEADELRTIIDAAKQPLKTMILLAINCGFGQNDVATLPLDAIDHKGAWIDFPRPKTETMRRCPLWKETVSALREAIDNRPEAKDQADKGLAFLTHRGAKWVRHQEAVASGTTYFNDYFADEFNKLLGKLGMKRRGSFYNLRHTFRTIADESKDPLAIDAIMGHTDQSMGSRYRERIDDARLLAVVNVVRSWLWPEAKRKKK